MKLFDLCRAAGLRCPVGAEEEEIGRVVADSRAEMRDAVFVCVRGERYDGSAFAREALARGAKRIVCESECIPAGCAERCIPCRDARSAYACMMHAICGFPDRGMKLIGVTGTNGKSTVTYLLSQILIAAGHSCGWIGTLGCYLDGEELDGTGHDPCASMTTPEPEVLYRVLTQMRERGARYVVMEVSSHALAQRRTEPLRFAVGAFTNLTPEHLDYHRDLEAYAEAKARLFEQSEIALVHTLSPASKRMIEASGGRARTLALEGAGDYRVVDLECREREISYRLQFHCGELMINAPTVGRIGAENTALAAAIALELGVEPHTVETALSGARSVKGRMEAVKLPPNAGFTVLIDYAHTPDALERLLLELRERGGAKKICLLFGCGGDRDRSKRSLMGQIASAYADRIILTSDNPRTEDRAQILQEILAGIDAEADCTVISNRREAIRYAILHAERGDTVVLAGKGHEEYEIDEIGKHPFSEREAVAAAYVERESQNQTER